MRAEPIRFQSVIIVKFLHIRWYCRDISGEKEKTSNDNEKEKSTEFQEEKSTEKRGSVTRLGWTPNYFHLLVLLENKLKKEGAAW